ncbi:uncharacterized protein C8R40DRAFT_1175871 [Lentinula edodes]|uniref:uncharacterized protein n=1 Tax=Lentinula edodes TaxID=5353 RepID=UPI001E8D3FD8|nr:uncharacterized protein C8R40DRAFT_1175871 [Lentinula edodes]KAH7870173.1 hypothetical protein C8R40DRAFT_1175871 [Lentinula edodes]
MQQGSEFLGNGLKPTAGTTATVAKVASFTFGEEEHLSKESVNANGKQHSSAPNMKAGPFKVARTTGLAKD